MMKFKNLYYKGDPEWLKRTQEEYEMIGFHTEIIDGELIVHSGQPPKKSKKQAKADAKAEKWSKRERNFGYARPN